VQAPLLSSLLLTKFTRCGRSQLKAIERKSRRGEAGNRRAGLARRREKFNRAPLKAISEPLLGNNQWQYPWKIHSILGDRTNPPLIHGCPSSGCRPLRPSNPFAAGKPVHRVATRSASPGENELFPAAFPSSAVGGGVGSGGRITGRGGGTQGLTRPEIPAYLSSLAPAGPPSRALTAPRLALIQSYERLPALPKYPDL
jgi:hypothetical protein